jgi:hypothetical protein
MTTIDTPRTPLIMTDPEVVPGSRSVKYRWVLSQEDVEEHGDHGVHYIYVTLSANHLGRSEIAGRLEYCLIARLQYEDITRWDRGILSQKFAVFGGGGIRLGQTECRRFSQKRLNDFAEAALVELRTRRDDDMVVSMFAGNGWDDQ